MYVRIKWVHSPAHVPEVHSQLSVSPFSSALTIHFVKLFLYGYGTSGMDSSIHFGVCVVVFRTKTRVREGVDPSWRNPPEV